MQFLEVSEDTTTGLRRHFPEVPNLGRAYEPSDDFMDNSRVDPPSSRMSSTLSSNNGGDGHDDDDDDNNVEDNGGGANGPCSSYGAASTR